MMNGRYRIDYCYSRLS